MEVNIQSLLEPTIQKACQEQIDFMVALCGCTHFPDELLINPYMRIHTQAYHQYVYDKAIDWSQKNQMGDIEIEHYDDVYQCPYPIFYNKRMEKTKQNSK